MSDYHTYYFKGRLERPFHDTGEFLKYAETNGVVFDLDSRPMPCSTNEPSFGPDTEYVGPSFSVWGVSVDRGELAVGVFASNLERDIEPDEDEAGIRGPSQGTRLENILLFLSHVTVGEPGQVQGAYNGPRFDYEIHAHPIIRCGDGQLRVAETPLTPEEDGSYSMRYTDERHTIAVPEVLPADLVSSGYEGAKFKLDIEALAARFRPIQIATPRVLPFR